MPKSKVRKKKGKPVKYTPKPTGISKTKMKKLMEIIARQQESMKEAPETPEIREGKGDLHISEEFTKKLNVLATDKINKGPELQESEKSHQKSSDEPEDLPTAIDENGGIEISQENEGPLSSDVE
jgi:hypothetical protein